MVLKLFVDPSSNISQKCVLSASNAQALGLGNGGMVKLTDDMNGKFTVCVMEVSSEVLDFSIKVAVDVLNSFGFSGLELSISPHTGGMPTMAAQPAAPTMTSDFNAGSMSGNPTTKSPFGSRPSQPAMNPTPSIPMNQPRSNIPSQMPSSRGPSPQKMSTPAYTPSSMSSPKPMAPTQPAMTPSPYVPKPVAPTPTPVYNPPTPTPSTFNAPSMTPPGGMSPPNMGMTPPGGMSPPNMGMTPPGGMSPPNMGMNPPGGMSPPSMNPPGMMPSVQSQGFDMNAMAPQAPPVPVDPYPNRIDVQTLASQKSGSVVLKPSISGSSLDGKVILSQNNVNRFGIYPNALVGWEDPLTRATASARVKISQIGDSDIMMDANSASDSNIKAEQIVVYSLEPPITHVDVINLEVEGRPLNGYIQVNFRSGKALGVNEGDILAFEDELTGAFGAAKVSFNENVPNNKIYIDQELLEASGVGSFSVNLKKNLRQIIPLQSLDLGISPITGENVWEVITFARTNINSIKQWLGNYIIYKGIKLRWKDANVALELTNSVPDLAGDVLATVTSNTTITLKPTGLVTFNAVLIIDISRSMMARDVEVLNIGPALEGIKAAMNDPEIQEFLKKFKAGTQVPRRMAAAFAAILFLAEKVGRGFGEKVCIIRFADEAQVLQTADGKLWMDSSSGQKGVLEQTAKQIVNDIGNAFGQSTNMGPAMVKTREIIAQFQQIRADQPTMVVMLTDGVPTDGDAFYQNVQMMSQNPNVVFYIIGLGNPDDEAMKRAAALCGGEYFKPKDSGELLVWYSKRARDLQIKLKHQ